MSERSTWFWIIWAPRAITGGLIAFAVLCVFMAGIKIGTDAIREQAIEAGVGAWTVDEKTGELGFEFRSQE